MFYLKRLPASTTLPLTPAGGALAYAVSVGVVYREDNQPFAGHPTGSEADFGVAVGARALDRKLLIGPELSGTTIVSDSSAVFGSRTTPLAILYEEKIQALRTWGKTRARRASADRRTLELFGD